MKGKTEQHIAELWEDLVVSILSVNGFTVETTYKLIDSLKHEGLVHPANLIKWDTETIAKKLVDAKYDRGEFLTNLLASRLKSLGVFVKEKTLEKCEQVLLSKNKQDIRDFFIQVNGIGSKVFDNFFLLSN